MKNMLKYVYLPYLIVVFMACHKKDVIIDNQTIVTMDYTVSIQYLDDCSGKPVPTGTIIYWGKIPLTTDKNGMCIHKYQRTDFFGNQSIAGIPIYIDGKYLNYDIIYNWHTAESIVIVKNESITVDVDFTRNQNTSYWVNSPSFDTASYIGYAYYGYVRAPKLTKDTSFTVQIKFQNSVYRKTPSGRFEPQFNSLSWGTTRPIHTTSGFMHSRELTGPCGYDRAVIK